jgi:hypothetical protein
MAHIAKDKVDDKIEQKKQEQIAKGKDELYIEKILHKTPEELNIEEVTEIKSLTQKKYEDAQKVMSQKYPKFEIMAPEQPMRSFVPVPIERSDPVPALFKEDRFGENLGSQAKNQSSKGMIGSAKDMISGLYHKAKESLGIIEVTPRHGRGDSSPVMYVSPVKRAEPVSPTMKREEFSPTLKKEEIKPTLEKEQVSPTLKQEEKLPVKEEINKKFGEWKLTDAEKTKLHEEVERMKAEHFDKKESKIWSEYFSGSGFE